MPSPLLSSSSVPLSVSPAAKPLISGVRYLRLGGLLSRQVLQSLAGLIGQLFPSWDRLSFVMEPQQQTNWCWSALTVSVSRFYDPSSMWTQCLLANNQLGQSTCCANGGSAQCNRGWYPERSLPTTGNLARHELAAAPFQGVDAEIDGGRPIGVRVDWAGGGAHAIAISGYLEGTVNFVAVADPWYGASDVAFSVFQGTYQGSGTWTETYYTRG
jgi:hypothetical protein